MIEVGSLWGSMGRRWPSDAVVFTTETSAKGAESALNVVTISRDDLEKFGPTLPVLVEHYPFIRGGRVEALAKEVMNAMEICGAMVISGTIANERDIQGWFPAQWGWVVAETQGTDWGSAQARRYKIMVCTPRQQTQESRLFSIPQRVPGNLRDGLISVDDLPTEVWMSTDNTRTKGRHLP